MSTVQSSPATACKNTRSEEHPTGVTGKNVDETASASDSGMNSDILPEAKALPLSVRTTQCALEIDTPMHRSSAGMETGTGVNKVLSVACPHLKQRWVIDE